MSNASKFVCAALPSIVTHFDNVLGDHPEYLNNETINSFLKGNVDKFLSSIGVVIDKLPKDPGKRNAILEKGRMNKELIDKYSNILIKMRNKEYLKDCEIIIDSAAFSLQVGEYFDKSEIIPFIDIYNNEFLLNNYNNFDYAFLFDVAPGATECPFDSFEEMGEIADYSYSLSSKLPEHVRNKCLYVHHFRTPKISNIYKTLLEKYGDNFINFATGGLVSFSRTGNAPIYVMYIVPLLQILQHAITRNIKKFRFHVLGGSEWKEIIGHKFLERHIKEVFDIDVEITYDSSTLFKTLCMGRYTFYPNHEKRRIDKLTLRTVGKEDKKRNNKADVYVEDSDLTNEEYFYELCNQAVVPHGMKPLVSCDLPLYQDIKVGDLMDPMLNKATNKNNKFETDSNGRFSRLSYTYGMMQMLNLFKTVEVWCAEEIDNIYPLFSNYEKNEVVINKKFEDLMKMLNGGFTHNKNISLRAVTISKTLKLVDEFKENPTLVLEKLDGIVREYMHKDECVKLRPPLEKSQPSYEDLVND